MTTDETDGAIRALAGDGHGIRRIARDLGLREWAVRKAMKRLGVGGKVGRRPLPGQPCPTCGGTGRVGR